METGSSRNDQSTCNGISTSLEMTPSTLRIASSSEMRKPRALSTKSAQFVAATSKG